MIAEIPWYVWLAIIGTMAYIWYDWANGPKGPDDYAPYDDGFPDDYPYDDDKPWCWHEYADPQDDWGQ